MVKICIIGGGAAGLTAAVMLARRGGEVTILERGQRLGRKLSATGNGQGNVTNLNMGAEHYFSDEPEKVRFVLSAFGASETVKFLESMGGIFLPDSRGRVYPASRQASAVTDLFRRELVRLGVRTETEAQVQFLRYKNGFTIGYSRGEVQADIVVLAAGGKAAPNFGTDGSAYALAGGFSHTVTPLSPALVQLRCEPKSVKGLKGIRAEAGLGLYRGRERLYETRGDVLFTDSGVSGDAVFRASSYAREGDTLRIDFLPDVSRERLTSCAGEGEDGLLCIVKNAVARALFSRAQGDRKRALELVKAFPLTVTGTMGFSQAQVTRGGIPLAETDAHLMSKYRKGLYFAGEILNVDGECGGYNLQWAFSSAYTVAEAILSEAGI